MLTQAISSGQKEMKYGDKVIKYRYLEDEWHGIDSLMLKNKKEDALCLATQKTVKEATNYNFNKLKLLYKALQYNKPFDEYWKEAVDSTTITTPGLTVKFIDSTILELGKPNGKWIFIDIWGNWCSPCVKGLPELQKLYQENLKKGESGLSIYTFSYHSSNLKDFLKNNSYSFPVAEIDEIITKKFNLMHYPTKILITPSGRYLIFPYILNWQECLRNYGAIK
jgi:thiol-disulfide isomerase/thioredoxin